MKKAIYKTILPDIGWSDKTIDAFKICSPKSRNPLEFLTETRSKQSASIPTHLTSIGQYVLPDTTMWYLLSLSKIRSMTLLFSSFSKCKDHLPAYEREDFDVVQPFPKLYFFCHLIRQLVSSSTTATCNSFPIPSP